MTDTHLELLHPLVVLQSLLLCELSGRGLLPGLELGCVPLPHLLLEAGLVGLYTHMHYMSYYIV